MKRIFFSVDDTKFKRHIAPLQEGNAKYRNHGGEDGVKRIQLTFNGNQISINTTLDSELISRILKALSV